MKPDSAVEEDDEKENYSARDVAGVLAVNADPEGKMKAGPIRVVHHHEDVQEEKEVSL